MPTSEAPSYEPPKQDMSIFPFSASTMVEAWQALNGGLLNTSLLCTMLTRYFIPFVCAVSSMMKGNLINKKITIRKPARNQAGEENIEAGSDKWFTDILNCQHIV
ncbi:MAG: hypothetical protein HC905_07300 [Bacteroidales bacterium]|nr:hypothetical protein [Bacteroidales bacterium]